MLFTNRFFSLLGSIIDHLSIFPFFCCLLKTDKLVQSLFPVLQPHNIGPCFYHETTSLTKIKSSLPSSKMSWIIFFLNKYTTLFHIWMLRTQSLSCKSSQGRLGYVAGCVGWGEGKQTILLLCPLQSSLVGLIAVGTQEYVPCCPTKLACSDPLWLHPLLTVIVCTCQFPGSSVGQGPRSPIASTLFPGTHQHHCWTSSASQCKKL